LYTESDDYANFHARVEANVSSEGNAGFCFRVPSIVNGELGGSGREAIIDATGSDGKTGSLLDFGREGQSKTAFARASDWFTLEVIAIGRRIIVTVNGQLTANVYDRGNSYNRGHLALHQIGAKTEVRFRSVEVRRLDLGNDPAEVATGGQPRSLVAQAFNGKQYMVFGQVLSWKEARIRCRDLGGRLAFPINEEENRFLTTLAKGQRINEVWLGASDEHLAGQWVSVDGSEVQYQNWDPDLLEQIDGGSQQPYSLLLVSRDGKWAYQPNISALYRPGFICQWD
jgi:hypothetical protein